MAPPISRRAFLGTGGALVVGLGLGGRALRRAAAQAGSPLPPTVWTTDRYLGKTVAPDQVDAFLAIHADDTVTVFTGKVDLGTGGRAAMRQMVAEELDVAIERITELIEGDTALCPDQGGTGGSTGISRGGQELRRAAATARQAILALGAQRLGRPVADLETADGVVRPKGGGPGVAYGALIGDRQVGLKIDAKAPLKPSSAFRYIGQSVRRPDVPAKATGRHLYVQDLALPGMLHGRAIRPPALGATLQSVDESSIAGIPGARVVRIGSFLGVVAEREWDAVRAARLLKAQWSAGTGLPDSPDAGRRGARDADRAGPGRREAGRSVGARRPWPRRADARRDVLVAGPDPRLPRAVVRRGGRSPRRCHDLDAVPGHPPFPRGVRQDPESPPGEGAADLPRRRGLLRPERRRGRGLRRGAPLARGGPAGAGPVDARGRARLGPERAAPAPRSPGRGGRGGRRGGVGDPGLAAALDAGPAEPPAAGAHRGRARPAARPRDRPGPAEHRPALSRGSGPRRRALARGLAVPDVPDPRARARSRTSSPSSRSSTRCARWRRSIPWSTGSGASPIRGGRKCCAARRR